MHQSTGASAVTTGISVCTYVRVSSDEQAEKDISIPAQRKALRRWVEQQGYTLVREFADEGESAYASASKRPGFMEMISFCRKNGVKYILVHKLDRFSRNREESILFKGLLRKQGVMVKSISENFDPETPHGFLYESMIEAINEFYSRNLASETIKGMAENAERGFSNGGLPPFGYRFETIEVDGRPRRRLTPGPDEEVALVRRVFQLATQERLGAGAISSLLNEEHRSGKQPRRWTKEAIRKMLDNTAYKGEMVWGRHPRSKHSVGTSMALTYPIVHPDTHIPLIEPAVFDSRKATSSARGFREPRAREGHGKYLLTRLMKCNECGHNFVATINVRKTKSAETKEWAVYRCAGHMAYGTASCSAEPLPLRWIDQAVLQLLREELGTPSRLAELERQIREGLARRFRKQSTDHRAVVRRAEEIDRRIANYYRAIGDGLDAQICQQHIADLQRRRMQLEDDAVRAQEEEIYRRAVEKCVNLLQEHGCLLQEDFGTKPIGIQRKVLGYFVERVEVIQRRTLHVVLRLPLDPARGRKLLEDLRSGWPEGEDCGETAQHADGGGAGEDGARRGGTSSAYSHVERVRRGHLLGRSTPRGAFLDDQAGPKKGLTGIQRSFIGWLTNLLKEHRVARPSNTAERRAQITRGLMKVMAEKGYDGASMTEVAAAAGLTPGLIHYHFHNKQEILLALLQELVGQHDAALETRLNTGGPDPLEQVNAFLDFHLSLGADANPEALASWLVISAEALRQLEVRAAFETAIAGYVDRLAALITQGVEKGRFGCASPHAAAGALMATIQGYYVLAATARRLIPRGSAAQSVRQMARGLLEPVAPLLAQEQI